MSDGRERAGDGSGELPDAPPPRVRVTAPRPGGASVSWSRASAPTSDIQGEYVRSLIRSQLRVALVCAGGFVLATVAFLLVISLVPDLDDTFVFGVPLSWLLLAVGVYPLAITVAVLYVRSASRNEARYRSLTEDA
ncbi:DUF63 family protein [Agromyces intestinalis]|uniref:DUF63 family protein n=1 Tax=Agromyces intestinalis TaxID=2592652 RepID=UPI001FEC8FD8|nr:DUF63 family protein [Agromyces intestinalis]